MEAPGTKNIVKAIKECDNEKVNKRFVPLTSMCCNGSRQQGKKIAWCFAAVIVPYVLKNIFLVRTFDHLHIHTLYAYKSSH